MAKSLIKACSCFLYERAWYLFYPPLFDLGLDFIDLEDVSLKSFSTSLLESIPYSKV